MISYLSMVQLPKNVQKVIKALEKAGFEAYAVGGSVRDIITKRKTKGWDFTTNAKPEEILKIFPDSFYDNKFGTVGIKVRSPASPAGRQKSEDRSQKTEDVYEITTYRNEFNYKDHRHPEKIVWGKTLEKDLARRDFTINAIATDGKKIIDPFLGLKDIERKLIRAVGNPNARFEEDALRIMRAARIAAELGFIIEENTRLAMKKHASLLLKISKERVGQEFLRLMSAQYAPDGILLLKNSGVLGVILPELDTAFQTPQKSPKRHHIFDVGTHSVKSLKHCPSQNAITRLATLIHDIGKVATYKKTKEGIITFYNHEIVSARMSNEIAERLRLSHKQKKTLYTLVRWHQFSVDERQTDSAIRRFIRRVGKENLHEILALRVGDRLGGGALETSWRLELFKKRLNEVQIQPFTVADLSINGNDVMKEFNIPPGPKVGEILNIIFAKVEEKTLPNERKKLLEKLKELKSEIRNTKH